MLHNKYCSKEYFNFYEYEKTNKFTLLVALSIILISNDTEVITIGVKLRETL